MRSRIRVEKSFYFLVRIVCKKLSKLGKVVSEGLCIRTSRWNLSGLCLCLRNVQVLIVAVNYKF